MKKYVSVPKSADKPQYHTRYDYLLLGDSCDGTRLLVFEGDGRVDADSTLEYRREVYGEHFEPNPPPDKVGQFHPKTIVRRSLELIDCGSCKSKFVIARYIDRGGLEYGDVFPSIETTAKELRKVWPNHTQKAMEKAVSRANTWWRSRGHEVNGEYVPFLTIVRSGKKRLDGHNQSNAYHIGWMAFIALAAEKHYDPKIQEEAGLLLKAADPKDRYVSSGRTHMSPGGGQICPPNPGNTLTQGNINPGSAIRPSGALTFMDKKHS